MTCKRKDTHVEKGNKLAIVSKVNLGKQRAAFYQHRDQGRENYWHPEKHHMPQSRRFPWKSPSVETNVTIVIFLFSKPYSNMIMDHGHVHAWLRLLSSVLSRPAAVVACRHVCCFIAVSTSVM